MSKIAVDFDGVICDLEGIVREHDFSQCKPKKDAKETIEWLLAQGHDIWIFTARGEEEVGYFFFKSKIHAKNLYHV